MPLLPNPGIAEDGSMPCNEPFDINGTTVAYCGRWVKPIRSRWRKQRPATHRGPHRIEWWDEQ